MTGKEIMTIDVVRQFLDCFGVMVDPFADPAGFIETLQTVDPRYQGEHRLRFQLEADQTTWPEEVKTVVMACVKKMRMLEPSTTYDCDFDATIILGGARQSNLDRVRFAVGLNSSLVVVAGSNRLLPESERENVVNYDCFS